MAGPAAGAERPSLAGAGTAPGGTPVATTDAPEPALACRGLRLDDPRGPLGDVSFELPAGGSLGLLGGPGSGAGAVAAIVVGALRPAAGVVVVGGRQARPGVAPDGVGFVPAEPALYPDLGAADNLRFFGRLAGLRGRELEGRVAALLERVGLAERGRDRAATLGPSMRQRLSLAIALMRDPAVLVLVEPTRHLDVPGAAGVAAILGDLRDDGVALLVATGSAPEAAGLCPRVILLVDGRVVADGSPDALAARVGERRRVTIRADGPLEAAAGTLRALAGVDSVLVRAGRIECLVPADAPIPAIVEAVTAAGAAVLTVDVARPDLEAVYLHLAGRPLAG